MPGNKRREPLLVEPLPLDDWEQSADGSDNGDLPEELSPEYFLKIMMDEFPKELYLAQLRDWFNEQVKGMPKVGKKGYMNKAEEKIVDAGYWLSRGRDPEELDIFIDGLPPYREVNRTIGKSTEKAFQDYAVDYMDEQDVKEMSDTVKRANTVESIRKIYGEAAAAKAEERLLDPQEAQMIRQQKEQERQLVRKKLLGSDKERYGEDVADAVNKGYITVTEAEEQLRKKTRDKLLSPFAVRAPEDREKLAEAVRQGTLTSQQAFGTLSSEGLEAKTERAMEAGARPGASLGVDENGQPIQPRNPWGKWQREQAAELNAKSQSFQGDKVGFTALLQEAASMGMDVKSNPVYEQILQPGVPEETQKLWANALRSQLSQMKAQKQSDYAGYLAKDYPDLYEKWKTQPGVAQNTFGGESFSPVQFMSSLYDEEKNMTPEFREAFTQKEGKRWGEYGDIYPKYLSQLSKTGYRNLQTGEPYAPFETWLTQDPEALIWNENVYRPRKAAREEQARKRLAPQGIYRT